MKIGVVSELTGSSDICQTVTDFASLQAKDYLEEDEAVLFALSSAREEYVFTNTSLVTACGSTAMSTKRTAERYEYMTERVTQFQFESCGVTDRDCELKFHIGSRAFSIDITKAELAKAQHFYRVLLALSREQTNNARTWELARTALDASVRSTTTTDTTSKLLVEQATGVHAWLQETFAKTNPRCYQSVIQATLEHAVQA
ncbi:Bacterial ph-like domain, partial [Globisporangium splendens]